MKEWIWKLIFVTIALMTLSKFILSNIEVNVHAYVKLDHTGDVRLTPGYGSHINIEHAQKGGAFDIRNYNFTR